MRTRGPEWIWFTAEGSVVGWSVDCTSRPVWDRGIQHVPLLWETLKPKAWRFLSASSLLRGLMYIYAFPHFVGIWRVCSSIGRKLWIWLFGGPQKLWSMLWEFRGPMKPCRYQAFNRWGGPPTQQTHEHELLAHSLRVLRVIVGSIPKDLCNVKIALKEKVSTKGIHLQEFPKFIKPNTGRQRTQILWWTKISIGLPLL